LPVESFLASSTSQSRSGLTNSEQVAEHGLEELVWNGIRIGRSL
jgi:hypothetical protein